MLDSLLRTLVPVIVGAALGQAARIGLDLDADTVTAIITPTITAAYYTLARVIEQVWPAAGRILLSAGLAANTPVYLDKHGRRP